MLQMYWFTYFGATLELNPWDTFTSGRLDQHLSPFYEKDIVAERLDDTLAPELLECLWVKLLSSPAPVKVGAILKEPGAYIDFSNINTGGVKEGDEDGMNRISYLILNCMEDMRQNQPNSNVQILKKTPDEFPKRVCEIVHRGWGQPAFYNIDEMIGELVNEGKSLTDARNSGCSGCTETGAWGTENYILTDYVNIPERLEFALHNGYDPMFKQQIGPKTDAVEDMKSYENVWQAFEAQLKYCIDVKMRGNQITGRIFAEMMPAPLLLICTDDCISRDRDHNAGDARYGTCYIQGVGISDVTDALVSIKYNIFDRECFSLAELMKVMSGNFEGHPEIYNHVCNKTPKYGNGDEHADKMMIEALSEHEDYTSGRPAVNGGTYYVNISPTTCHVYFGDVMIADADGRRVYMSLVDGISPTKGGDTNGPASVVTSRAKMDQRHTGSCLLSQKFTPIALAGQRDIGDLVALIRSYFEMRSRCPQFNVISRETLIDAQRNPEKYKDLIVHVAGYSDYLNNLDPKLQSGTIERTKQEFA